MASWIVHLRVAEGLLESLGASRAEFIVGNIAPDCGVADENGGFFPPASVTHWTESSKGACEYDRFYEQLMPTAKTDAQRSLLLGYFCHLMTDVLWSRHINAPTKERLHTLYSTDRDEYYRIVKADWYDSDAEFLTRHKDYHMLNELSAARGCDCSIIPYYGADNVEKQIAFIGEFYKSRVYDGRELVYLTPQQADEFVKSTVSEILSYLEKTGRMM